MQIIRYHEMEKLLTLYTDIIRIIEIIKSELHRVEEDEQEKENQLIKTKEELSILQLILDKLNIGLKALPVEVREVIMCKYFEGFTWAEINYKLYINKQQGQRKRRNGIEKMRGICRITLNQYNQVLIILNIK